MPSCIIVGCNNRTFRKSKKQEKIEEEQKITFHAFPNNKIRRLSWCAALNIPENSVKQNAVICSMHFHSKDFDKSSLVCVKLKADAIPHVRYVDTIVYICHMCVRLHYFIIFI
ncbi:THAP domain-containing protein 9 [Cyphomyrmex costatus]|uniref:THAP domain-containing protein 9 n=1 Tax=Cyphomyrmex costatus TaxID=456900 RepID=A0A151I8Z3_9HYME|nr:THAP domain-containing protein 9 [Cyphomyrmex costatus]